jgi:hypothetical protein
MASIKVVDIISRVRRTLQDTTSVRWTLPELQDYINDSYRDIVNLRPDANTATADFTCVVGPRQDLTTQISSATRLIEVVRNVAATSAKGAVRLVNRRQLDDQRRGWYAETASIDTQHYVFDPRVPKEFLVYPPATVQTQLEVVYAAVPPAHALTEVQLGTPSTAELIRLDDSYGNVIQDYVLYRCYTKDAEYASNAQRAVAHYQAFQTALGVSAQANAASQPGAA